MNSPAKSPGEAFVDSTNKNLRDRFTFNSDLFEVTTFLHRPFGETALFLSEMVDSVRETDLFVWNYSFFEEKDAK
jgi:hypothetical protein